jgi:hypothetical protein
MANRYWVGGTDNWNGTAGSKWSETSGGAGGASVPTSSDDVFFDANSGNVTVTISASVNCRHFNTTGFPGTLAGSSQLTISGSMTLGSGMTWSKTGTTLFNATSAQNITTNGVVVAGSFTLSGSGGSWTLQDNFNSIGGITLTTGGFNANNKNLRLEGAFSSTSSNTRSITMGSGTWEFAGTGATWNVTNASNLTFNKDTATIELTNSTSSARTISSANLEIHRLVRSAGTGSLTITDLVCANVEFLSTGSITVNGTGTVLGLSADALVGAITWNAGTLNTNNYQITATGGIGLSGTTARAINLGSSLVICANWTATDPTNLTLNVGTSTIRMNGGTSTFAGGGLTYYNVEIVSDSASILGPTITGANTFNDLLRTNASNYAALLIAATQTINGTFTVTGANNGDARILVRSSVRGTARTIIAANTSLTNTDFEDTVADGAAAWSGISIGNCGGNSGITFTSPTTKYWIGNGGDWADASHWASTSGGTGGVGMPLPHDTAKFDENSFSSEGQTVAATTINLRLGKDIDFRGVTNSPTFNRTQFQFIYGSLYLDQDMSITGVVSLQFSGRGNHEIDLAGKTIPTSSPFSVVIDSLGGSYTLASDFRCNGILNVNNGTFDANNFDVIIHSFNSSNSNVRSIMMGSGIWEINGGNTDNLWNLATVTNLTFDCGTSLIKMTGNLGAAFINFHGGGRTYYDFWNATTGDRSVDFTGSNTFNNFKINPGRTVKFTAATTTTVASLDAKGTQSNGITIGSITAANHNLTKTGEGRIVASYLTVSRSQASPADTFYAIGSTDGGNNSGWNFLENILEVDTLPADNPTFESVIGHAEVLDAGDLPVQRRGFVFSTLSQGNPGNVSPESSDYEGAASETGEFEIGEYDLEITDLADNTNYFIRAFAYNGVGYSYGNEVEIETDVIPGIKIFIDGVDRTSRIQLI